MVHFMGCVFYHNLKLKKKPSVDDRQSNEMTRCRGCQSVESLIRNGTNSPQLSLRSCDPCPHTPNPGWTVPRFDQQNRAEGILRFPSLSLGRPCQLPLSAEGTLPPTRSSLDTCGPNRTRKRGYPRATSSHRPSDDT